jgi:hypothetical protein
MNDQAADWLALTVITLFCATMLYGGAAIQTLIR